MDPITHSCTLITSTGHRVVFVVDEPTCPTIGQLIPPMVFSLHEHLLEKEDQALACDEPQVCYTPCSDEHDIAFDMSAPPTAYCQFVHPNEYLDPSTQLF